MFGTMAPDRSLPLRSGEGRNSPLFTATRRQAMGLMASL